jgi:hypothetical protein
MDEQHVRADPDLVAIAQLGLPHALTIDKRAISAAVTQNIGRAPPNYLAMTARNGGPIENHIAILIASDGRNRLSQKQACATGAQTTNETHTKFARGKTGCGSPLAKRHGDSRFLKTGEILFLTDHYGPDPLKAASRTHGRIDLIERKLTTRSAEKLFGSALPLALWRSTQMLLKRGRSLSWRLSFGQKIAIPSGAVEEALLTGEIIR